MGQYVDPSDCTKEEFLKAHGTILLRSQAESHSDFKNNLLVVLVDNGMFTAAGICYDKQEHSAWMADKSYRPMKYYLVPKEKLLPYL